jgi:hypothetical protein
MPRGAAHALQSQRPGAVFDGAAAVTIGRRYELLMAVAARNISEARRNELLELASKWMRSDACGVKSHEELFYMWGALAGIQLRNYTEDLQAKWGAEVMDDLGAKVDA